MCMNARTQFVNCKLTCTPSPTPAIDKIAPVTNHNRKKQMRKKSAVTIVDIMSLTFELVEPPRVSPVSFKDRGLLRRNLSASTRSISKPSLLGPSSSSSSSSSSSCSPSSLSKVEKRGRDDRLNPFAIGSLLNFLKYGAVGVKAQA